MEISARNQLKGKVKHVTPGAVMSEVVVDIGGQEVVSMISKASVERLGAQAGRPGGGDHQGHRGDHRQVIHRMLRHPG
jgi:molybdopterin-binding protein